MAKKHGSQTRKKATAQPPEIHVSGNTIVISSTIPWTFQEDTHFGVNDTLSLTFKMEFDTKKLAKFIEKQGPPPKGKSFPAWAKKIALAVGKAGLVEAATKGVDLIFSAPQH